MRQKRQNVNVIFYIHHDNESSNLLTMENQELTNGVLHLRSISCGKKEREVNLRLL